MAICLAFVATQNRSHQMALPERENWTQVDCDTLNSYYNAMVEGKLSPTQVTNYYPAPTPVDLQFQIAKLELKEDDIVLIQYHEGDVTQLEVDCLVRGLGLILNENIKAMIVNDRFKFSVISKKEADEIVTQQRKPP